MAITLNDINNRINDRRRDTGDNTLDITTVGFRAIQSTIDLMQQTHDWEWTIQKSGLTFHKGITWIDAPTDLKVPMDLRKQKAPNRTKEYAMVSANSFDSETLKTDRFAITTRGTMQYVRVQTEGGTTQINAATSVDADGTWVGTIGITDVATDSYEFFDLQGSVSFTYDGTSGVLTNSDMSNKDLTAFKDRAKVYMNMFLPSVTNFTSIVMVVGSDASNYYTDTATTDYLGKAPVTGWNKFEFDIWDSVTGTPDDDAINYIKLTLNYSSTPNDENFRIENIFASEDVPLDFYYYSLNTVYDVSGTADTQNFNDSSATGDFPLWSGTYDFVTESFVDAVLEQIFWITGETTDYTIAQTRRLEIFNNLKQRVPSRRRHPEAQMSVLI